MRRQTFHATFPDGISSNTSKDNACKVNVEDTRHRTCRHLT